MGEAEDVSAGKYGNLGILRSSEEDSKKNKDFVLIKDLNITLKDRLVLLRGRLHTSRSKGTYFCF